MALRPEAAFAGELPMYEQMFCEATAIPLGTPSSVTEGHNSSEPVPQLFLIEGCARLHHFSQQTGAGLIGIFRRSGDQVLPKIFFGVRRQARELAAGEGDLPVG